MQIYTFFINDNNIFIHTLPPWHPNAVSEAENRLTGTRHCCISLLAKPSALPKNISVYQQFEKNIAKLFGHIEKSVYFCSLNHNETGSFGRGARHRSAKPATPVQIRKRPPTAGNPHRVPSLFLSLGAPAAPVPTTPPSVQPLDSHILLKENKYRFHSFGRSQRLQGLPALLQHAFGKGGLHQPRQRLAQLHGPVGHRA